MKILVLIIIIFMFLLILHFIKKFNLQNNIKKNESIIDLEKDSKTNEYKPKE